MGISPETRRFVQGLEPFPPYLWEPDPGATFLMLEAMNYLVPLFPGSADRKARVLDVGTGTGVLILHAVENLGAGSGIATDVNPYALDFVKQKIEEKGLSQKVQLREGSLFDPVPGEKFDLILANSASSFMAENVLRSASSYLTKDGLLLFMWLWSERKERYFKEVVAYEGNLFVAPILISGRGREFAIYAASPNPARIEEARQMVKKAISANPDRAGLEEKGLLYSRKVRGEIRRLIETSPWMDSLGRPKDYSALQSNELALTQHRDSGAFPDLTDAEIFLLEWRIAVLRREMQKWPEAGAPEARWKALNTTARSLEGLREDAVWNTTEFVPEDQVNFLQDLARAYVLRAAYPPHVDEKVPDLLRAGRYINSAIQWAENSLPQLLPVLRIEWMRIQLLLDPTALDAAQMTVLSQDTSPPFLSPRGGGDLALDASGVRVFVIDPVQLHSTPNARSLVERLVVEAKAEPALDNVIVDVRSLEGIRPNAIVVVNAEKPPADLPERVAVVDLNMLQRPSLAAILQNAFAQLTGRPIGQILFIRRLNDGRLAIYV
ncbi:MAG: methyltransferase domain-containing protein [Candidatus Omnitrophica bacterium]|nr:methyltransferase domain-containing protein [Candidatus Omnitrophota bacterium]